MRGTFMKETKISCPYCDAPLLPYEDVFNRFICDHCKRKYDLNVEKGELKEFNGYYSKADGKGNFTYRGVPCPKCGKRVETDIYAIGTYTCQHCGETFVQNGPGNIRGPLSFEQNDLDNWCPGAYNDNLKALYNGTGERDGKNNYTKKEVSCPNCGAPVKTDIYAIGKYQCNHCGKMFMRTEIVEDETNESTKSRVNGYKKGRIVDYNSVDEIVQRANSKVRKEMLYKIGMVVFAITIYLLRNKIAGWVWGW